MAGHDLELGEVVAHDVEQFDVLAHARNSGAGDSGTHEDRDTQLGAHRVDRIPTRVVDGHLRRATGGEGAHRLQPVLVVQPTDLANLVDTVVGIGATGRDEPLRILGQRPHTGVTLDADHRAIDTEVIHGVDGHLDGVDVLGQGTRHVLLEEVLDREHRLLALLVADVPAEELVETTGVGIGESHHGLDDPQASGTHLRHHHDQIPPRARNSRAFSRMMRRTASGEKFAMSCTKRVGTASPSACG